MRPGIDRLRDLFEVDATTGVIRRRGRPLEDFSAPRHWRMWNARFKGGIAGNRRGDGYVMVRVIIDGRKYDILGHVLVWALVYGRWPANELDHRDGVHDHNWIGNLREATRPEQMQNMRPGKRGTGFDARDGRWQARIRVNGQPVTLGRFDTEEAAHRRYLEAKAELHTFQPVPRK